MKYKECIENIIEEMEEKIKIAKEEIEKYPAMKEFYKWKLHGLELSMDTIKFYSKKAESSLI